MDILTDEIVEKGARALYHKRGGFLSPLKDFDWERVPLPTRVRWGNAARAALQAVLPDVVEKCRQAVVNQVRLAPAQQQWSAGYDAAIEDASSAIRSLLNKEDNANV